MTGFADLILPATGQDLKNTIDGNNTIANSMKLVLRSENTASQFLASAIGTVEDISYGTPSVEETAYATLTAGGTIVTAVTAGLYFASFKLQVSRTGAAATSVILTRTVFTPSGGSATPGPVRLTEIDDANTSLGLTVGGFYAVNAGDSFKGEFVKDSGNIGVELSAMTTVTAGWADSPSASVEVYKMNENGTTGVFF